MWSMDNSSEKCNEHLMKYDSKGLMEFCLMVNTDWLRSVFGSAFHNLGSLLKK